MDDDDRDAPVTLRELRQLDATWSSLEKRVERERGVLGWMRRRGFVVRWMAAFCVAGLLPSLAGATMNRQDVGDIHAERIAFELSILFVVALGASFVCAWPLHRPPPPRGVVLGIAVGALMLCVVLVLAPRTGGAELGCFVTCCASGMFALAPGWLAARAVSRGARGASVGAATLAGVSAFSALRTICADDSIAHGLAAHLAPILLALGVVTSLSTLRASS